MGKIIILPIIAAFIAIVAFAPQDAHAASYTATISGDWSSFAPAIVNPGDTVTINPGVLITIPNPAVVKNQGDIIIDGTLNINPGGTLKSIGTITVDPSGILNNLNIGKSKGLITNLGIINNFGTLTSKGTFTNSQTINNHNTITNGGILFNGNVINAFCGSNITPINGAIYVGNPTNPISCTSIPDFPFSYSLVIIFGAVAAVYMGIRQKMIPNFKSF
ncbi:MAG TPA: hypothetical protein VNX68_18990 [Nitrosopumilaceae archaeon]|jgi:hypothetical protein|nr:hypothetical protein [Nitrosopumilaceae archaeon]